MGVALAVGLGMSAGIGLGTGLASTLDTLPGAPGYVHEVFGVDDGLPMAGIVQALQTRDGFLWLATFDGLVRFDGVRFEVFDSERVPALGSNRIEDLLEGRDGTLWIRTEQGHVSRHAGGTFTACGAPGPDGAACDSREAGAAWYTLLTRDGAGTVWLSGPSGLVRFVDGRLRLEPASQTGAGVRRLAWDRAGRLWAASPEGAWVAEPGRPFRRVVSEPALVSRDAAGEVWISTLRGTGRGRGRVFAPEIPEGGTIVEDERGGILLAAGDRLLRSRGSGFELVARNDAGYHNYMLPGRNVSIGPGGEEWIGWRNTLYRNGVPALHLLSPPGNVSSVTHDGEGTLWITSSRSGELHALHPARLATFSQGLPDPLVYAVYEDRDGTVLAGGFEQASALAPGARSFRPLPRLPEPQLSVLSFLRDRAGILWMGTTPGGLFRQYGGGFVPAGPEALRTAEVRAIHEDARGVLWVGTNVGLFRRAAGRWSWIRPEDGLPFPWVRVIKETKDGALWLGTNGGGVIRLANGRFTSVRGLSSDLVRSIWEAPDGHLWIGTENRGLNRLDPRSLDTPGRPRIAVLSQRQGLHSNGIHQIVPDGLGNLWMSSNQGIFRVPLRELDAVADGVMDGRAARVDPVIYTERDGMQAREANGGGQDSGFRDRTGRIWFPTIAGVVRVDPRAALRRRPPPRPHVVRLLAGGEEVPLDSETRLSPAQRSFSVEITAPSFQAPGRLRLRYRLAPYDREWIDAGARREAVYTKVPPGHYIFEVAAASPGGEWSPRPAAVTLLVVPRFYETQAFLLACALAAGAVLVGGVRLWGVRQRTRHLALERLVDERTATIAEQAEKLRELDHLKSQLFANVSHELRTPLTLTLGPLRDLLEGRFGPLREEAAGQVAVALRNARRLLGLVDQLLDVARLDAGRLRLRPRRGDLSALVRERVETFLPLAERRGIDLSLEAPAEPVEIWFDEAQLEKVFDNLLGNALKFTPRDGKVQVTVAAPPGDRVEVRVQDDGPGIPAGQLERIFERFYQVEITGRQWPGAGIGLQLARQLVELHGGSISVASEEGRGACFTVSLRRGRLEGEAEHVERSAATPIPPDLPEEPPAEVDPESGPEPDEDRTTVLVVDDNAEIRAYVRRHLEPEYRVVEAADGREGLERARLLTPDLVLSDIMMPGLDGNALFRSLRENPELELVPVILLTAKASAEDRIQGLRDGVDDYLVKPFDPRELRARVDNLIASRRRLLERIGTQAPPRSLRVSEVSVTPADEALLARVQTLVEERLGDPELSVGALASALGCDRSYLLRKLRALTGESPSGLIRSLRLQRAEQLLRAGAGAVSEIAYAVGFKSVAHFSNAFHEQYGERPSVFAARHRGR